MCMMCYGSVQWIAFQTAIKYFRVQSRIRTFSISLGKIPRKWEKEQNRRVVAVAKMLEANCDRKMCQNKNRRDVVLDQKLEEILEMRLTVVLRRRPKM